MNQPVSYIKPEHKNSKKRQHLKTFGTAVLVIGGGVVVGAGVGKVIENIGRVNELKLELTYVYTVLGRVNQINPEVVQTACDQLSHEMAGLAVTLENVGFPA